MTRHKLDSVNEFAHAGYNLRITCDGCGRVIEASAVHMMQELVERGASMSIERLEERARCRVCGHRGATVTACGINF